MQDAKYKMQNSGRADPLGERSFRLAADSIRLVRSFPNDVAGRVVGTQFVRAATSVGANVAEAQGGSSRKDFACFLAHVLKSAHECRYWLRLIQEGGLVPREKAQELLNLVEEVRRLLGASIATVRGVRKPA